MANQTNYDGISFAPQEEGATDVGYLNVSPDQITKDPRFLTDLRKYYADYGKYFSTDQEYLDEFYEDATWRDLNTAGAVIGATYTAGESKETRARAKRLEQAWRQLPMFWQEGGRGFASAAPDIAKAIILDPVNLIPVVGAYGKAANVAKAAYLAGTAGREATKAGIKSGIITAGVQEAGIGALAEGVISTANQIRDVQLGLEDEVSLGRVAKDAVIGGATGGIIGGGVLGPVPAFIGARRGVNRTAAQVDELTGKGLTGQQIADTVAARGVTGFDELVEASKDTDAFLGPPETTETTTATESPTAEIDEKINQIKTFYKEEQDLLDSQLDDGVDPDIVAETEVNLNELAALREFGENLKAEQIEISKLEASNNPNLRAQAQKRRAIFERNYSKFRRATKGGLNLSEINEILEQYRAKPSDTADANPVETETTTTEATGEGTTTTEAAPEGRTEGTAPEADATATETVPADETVTATVEVKFDDMPFRNEAQKTKIQSRFNEEYTQEQFEADFAAGKISVGRDGKFTRDTVGEVTASASLARDRKAFTEMMDSKKPEPNETTVTAEPEAKTDEIIIDSESRGRALAAGLDPKDIPAAEASASGRITKRQVNKAINAAKNKPKSSYAQQVKRDLDTLLETIGEDIDVDENSLRALIRVMSQDKAAYRSDPDDILALFDEFNKSGMATGDKAFTKTELKKIRQLVRKIRDPKEGNPEFSKETAQILAERQVLNARDNPETQTESLVRSVQKSIDNKSIYETAGRDTRGRIQAMLRKSSVNVKPNEFAKEEAIIKATSGKGPDVVKYISGGETAIGPDGRKVRVKAGTTLFADGVTKRSFVSYEYLMKTRGVNIGKKSTKKVKQPTDETPTITNEVVQKLVADLQADGDTDKFIRTVKALQKKGAGVPEEPSATVDVPTTSAGKKLIVRSKNNAADVRMISQKQISEGKGIEAIIGQKGGPNSNPANWEIKYAPFDAEAKTLRARQELFESLPSGEVPGQTREDVIKKPMDEADFNEKELELSEAEVAIVNNILGDMGFRGANGLKGNAITGRTLMVMEDKLSMGGWPVKESAMDARIEQIAFLENLMAKIAPDGVNKPVQTRAEAKLAIENIFAGHSSEEIAGAKRLIDMLGGDPDKAPLIRGKTTDTIGAYRGYYTQRDNAVTMRTGQGRGTDMTQLTPTINVLYHEVGHWAYRNILTPEDRAQFWNIAKTHYKGGRVDSGSIDESRYLQNQTISKEGRPDYVVRQPTSPQEYFAEQFEMWVSRKKASPDLATEKFWQRIATYVKGIFDRYYYGAELNPDLEPIFAKIIPDVEEEVTFRLGVDGEPKKEIGKHIQKRLVQLQIVKEDIESAIGRDSPEAIVEAHKELQLLLLQMVPNSKVVARDGADAAIFSPLRKGAAGRRGMVKLIRDRINNYDEMIDGRQYGTDDGFDVRNYGDFSTQADLEKVAEQLKDFYYNGYAGTFKPAQGLPPSVKVENIGNRRSSTQNLIGMIDKQLNAVYQQKEGTTNLIGGSKPDMANKPPVRSNGKVQPSKTAKNTKIKNERIKEQTLNEAVQVAKTKKNSRARVTAKNTPAINQNSAESVKGKKLNDLLALFRKHKGTEYGDQIGVEIVNKIKSQPAPAKQVRVSRETFKLSGDALESELLDALHVGDKARVDEAYAEVVRRANNKRAKSQGGAAILKPKFKKAKMAIATEIAHNKGVIRNDGIPSAARASVREMLSYITHRDTEMQQVSRTIAYRMMNILNKSSYGTMQNANRITMDIMARLGRGDYAVTGDGAFGNYNLPDFKNFRNTVRRLATALNKGEDVDSGITELNKMVIRSGALPQDEMDVIRAAYDALDDTAKAQVIAKHGSKYEGYYSMTRDEMLANEWFGDSISRYMKEDITREDILELSISGDTQNIANIAVLDRAIDRTIEYSSYIANGQIGRQDVKNAYRRVSMYGDMFEDNAARPLAGSLEGKYLTHPSYAADYAHDSFMSMSKDKKTKILRFVKGGYGFDEPNQMPLFFYHGTPRGNKLKKANNPNVQMRPSEIGLYGPGIYVTENPFVASQMYARTPTFNAMVDAIDESNLSDIIKEDLHWDAYELTQVRRDIGKLRRQYASLQPDAYLQREIADERVLVKEQLDELIQVERGLVENMKKNGMEFESDVLPTVIKLDSPADFRATSVYQSEDDPFLQALMAKFNEEDVPAEMISSLSMRGVDGRAFGPRTGEDIYNSVIDAFVRFGGRSKTGAQAEFNNMLQEMGYDGLLTTHRNSLNDGDEFVEVNRTYGASSIQHETAVLFNSNQIKHIDADEFNDMEYGIYAQTTGNPIPKGAVGSMARGLQDGDFNSINDIPVGEFGELLESAGGDPNYVGALMSLMRKRTLTPAEEETIRKSSPVGFLKSQSNNLRDMGARWLGDWYENHFPNLNQRFAGIYFPIQKAMRDLPDSDGSLKRYFKKSVNVGTKITDKIAEQPKSHAKIVKALRYGDGSRHETALTDQERVVYRQIRGAFEAERQAMLDAGLMVGYRQNYFPQVWNAKAIGKDRDKFVEVLQRYYNKDALLNGRTPTDAEAKDFAEGVMMKLVDDEDGADGTFIPVKGTTRSPTFDNVDYSRVLELDRPEFIDELRDLEKYLESDLDALLVKYFEGSSRKMTHVDELGINSHAVYDYMQVAEEGIQGIAKLLSTNKQFRFDRSATNASGMRETFTLQDVIRMPFANSDAEALKFAEQLVNTHNGAGAPAARQLLYSVAPIDPRTGRMNQTYKRRADAIVHALDDFKGKTGVLQPQDYDFIERSLKPVMKKPLTTMGGKAIQTASRNVRFFNNITLLSYTTLTSLGDLMLPIIRSGSMKSWMKGMYSLRDAEMRQAIRNTGVAMENIIHERMIHLYGAPDGKASHAFFNATLLTDWTDMNRQIAAATGYNYFQAMQTKAFNNFKEGVPYAQQPASYKTAHRALKMYGLEMYLPGAEVNPKSLGDKNVLQDKHVKMAMIRFADDSIFQPNADDVPMWAQTPIGAVVFQLKSFPLMMTRLTGHVLKEANSGNFGPLLAFATLGPTFGMGTLAAKDILQSRGGEEGRTPEVRKRNILKSLGYDKKVHGDENDFLGWYVEGLIVMGGLGLIGDMMHTAVEQIDNGAYGRERMWGTLLGPTFGLGNSVANVFAGIGEEEGSGKARQAVREIANRIPVVGGNRAAKEAIVDAVAGETDDGSKSYLRSITK
tara:strand:- start:605 stop:10186 length:9582 start_codon:yes stop_codon:yes gene_type:complete